MMDYVSQALNAHKEALAYPQRKEFEEKIKNLGSHQRANIALEIMKMHPQFRDVVAKMQVGGILTMPEQPGKVVSTEITSNYTPKTVVKAPLAAKDKSKAKQAAKEAQIAEGEAEAKKVALLPLSELSEDIYPKDEFPQYVQEAQKVPRIKPYIPLSDIDKFDENLMPRSSTSVNIINPELKLATPYDYQGEYSETVPTLQAGVFRESTRVDTKNPELKTGEPYKFTGKYKETEPNIEVSPKIINIDPNLHPELAKASTLPRLKEDTDRGYVTKDLTEYEIAPFEDIKGTAKTENNIKYIQEGNKFWLWSPTKGRYESRNWTKKEMMEWANQNHKDYKLGNTKFRYR